MPRGLHPGAWGGHVGQQHCQGSGKGPAHRTSQHLHPHAIPICIPICTHIPIPHSHPRPHLPSHLLYPHPHLTSHLLPHHHPHPHPHLIRTCIPIPTPSSSTTDPVADAARPRQRSGPATGRVRLSHPRWPLAAGRFLPPALSPRQLPNLPLPAAFQRRKVIPAS